MKEANINKGTQTRLYRKYITPTKLPSNTKLRARKTIKWEGKDQKKKKCLLKSKNMQKDWKVIKIQLDNLENSTSDSQKLKSGE